MSMPETLSQPSDPITRPTYLPRVTKRDHRAIEDALAGATLFDAGVEIDSAVVEATYAVEDSPLLKRLRESGVPQLVDPQTLRFTGDRFLTVTQFSRIPYRPAAPIAAHAFTPTDANDLARGVLRFEQRVGASWYMAAALPCYDKDLQSWIDHNDRLLAASCAANGGSELDRRPLIAQVAPGRKLLAHPEMVIARLIDHPINAVYVQPLTLDPVKDGVEKLIQYVDFLRSIGEAGLPVIASRVGAFGLVLNALGVPAFTPASLKLRPAIWPLSIVLQPHVSWRVERRAADLIDVSISSSSRPRSQVGMDLRFWRTEHCARALHARWDVASTEASRVSLSALASIIFGHEAMRSTCSAHAQPKACVWTSFTSSYVPLVRLARWCAVPSRRREWTRPRSSTSIAGSPCSRGRHPSPRSRSLALRRTATARRPG